MKKAKSVKSGFKPETLKKLVIVLNALIKFYLKTLAVWHVRISGGNRKIGLVMNVSLAPIITCGKMCKHCRGLCYDIKACLQYVNVRIARAINTALALYDMPRYFAEIEAAINRRRVNKYFRWHVAGDIISAEYFAMMVEIARRHPDFIFWTYTKQYALVNAYIAAHGNSKEAAIPANLHIMFSEWKIVKNDKVIAIPFPNPYGMPIFTIRFAEEEIPNLFKCPGNCDFCKQHICGCIAGQSTYNDAH